MSIMGVSQKRMSFGLLIVGFSVGLLSAGRALAQTALTGGLRGLVTDARTKTPIPGAPVLVQSRSLSIRQESATEATGGFTFLGLPPADDYQVSVEAPGFRPNTRDRVVVSSGDTTIVDMTLELRPVSESITVTGSATPAIAASPEVSQVINLEQLTELPSNGRQLNRFALLDPHVRNTGGLGADSFTATRLSINGGSFRDTRYKLDGNTNYDMLFNNAPLQSLSLSAVQEFKVLTNQFSAEHGGTSTGYILTTTKAGTDEIHGDAFFFGRPSGLQVRPPLADRHIPNQRTQFGGSVGGPLRRGRTFYFGNYERVQQARGSFVESPAPLAFVGHFRNQLGLARLDHRFRDNHSLALRMNGHLETNDNTNDRVGGLIQPSAGQKSIAQSLGTQINDTVTFAHWINELRASYINSVPSRTIPLHSEVSIIRPNYSTEGASSFSTVRTQIYQLAEQVSWQAGRHALKFGAEAMRQKVRDRTYDEFGQYQFAPGPPQRGEQPTLYTQRFGIAALRYGQSQWAAFIQDDWRVTSRWTANLGLRYEYQSITDGRANFGPRLGFAWDVAGDGKTVLRGGAGIYYDQPFFHGLTQKYFLNGPYAPILTYGIPFGDPAFPTFPNSLSVPPSGATLARRNIDVRGNRLLNPYTSQFSFGVQRKLFDDWLVTADVIHGLSVKLIQAYDLNAPSPFPRTQPGQSRRVADADATRPFSTYMGIPVRQVLVSANAGSAIYNALDLGLSRRFSRRYQLEAHYVYSSALNNVTDDHLGANPNEWSNIGRAERGPSDFHQRHRFVTYGMVQLPWASQWSFVNTIASGLPVNPVTGIDNNGDTTLADRPPGLGRNAFRGPAHASLDMALAKNIPLSDRARLELRAEVFNLFNHANFYRVRNVYGNGPTPLPTFRQPLAGVANGDPGRQLQFALRLLF